MSEFSESETQVGVGDNVFPVHMLDDAKGVRDMSIVWMFRFNDALDAELLHSSLTRLICIGDWRKLGGRLRLKENGQLEIHVPDEFTTEHPAVGYSHDTFDMLTHEHPLACQLPKPTDTLSIQPPPSHFAELCGLAHMPQTLEDHLNGDIPQIHLHVTNFIDGTLVTFNFCHVTLDAPSQTALLRNWSRILSGQESKVEPLLGARNDALWEAGAPNDASKKEVYMQRPRRLKGAKLVKFLSRMLWNSYRSPEKEAHMLCVPHQFFQNLRIQAQVDIEDEGKDAFVGETDTLAAWAAHLVATSEPKKRPITLVNAMNARYRLSRLSNDSQAYAQNMMLPISFTSLKTEEALGSIGRIARINRQHLIEQATEEQMRSFLRLARKSRESGKGFMPIFGRSSAMPVFMNNLTKLGVLDAVDFSAAVTKDRTASGKKNAPGTPFYHHFQTIHAPSRVDLKIPDFVVFGKDHEDNYWIRVTAKPQVWERIQQEMGKLDLKA